MARHDTNRIYIAIFLIFLALLIYQKQTKPQDNLNNDCQPIWKEDRRYDIVTFCNQDEAIARANQIGCSGFHTHQQEGYTIYMSCAEHSDLLDLYISSGGSYGY